MIITVLSVSTPAVRDTVLYSRKIREEYRKEVDFRLHPICDDRDVRRLDPKKTSEDIAQSDLLVIDLMGAHEGIVESLSESLRTAKCQCIVISGFGPAKNRLGKLDEKRFRTNPEDSGNVKQFSEYWKNSEGAPTSSGTTPRKTSGSLPMR